jgi:phosphoribosylformimino-5-aminoimidazole carboxamide ribotide isomerase
MLIPSIDLMGNRIVQLVQGERLALESHAIDEWIDRFRGWSKVQLIDLDAAKNQGQNDDLVARICGQLPCRVGGGIRSLDRAVRVVAGGATHAIVGSALFKGRTIDTAFAELLATTIGPSRLIAAVDSKGGQVVVDAWRTSLPLTAADAPAGAVLRRVSLYPRRS